MISRDCEHRCPELDACINASLWCDGISHCPSGFDEALTHCSILLQLPPLHLGLACLGMIMIFGVLCFVSCRICRKSTSRSISQHRLKSISSETAIMDGKEVICWHSDNSVRYVEIDRVTTVWQSSSFKRPWWSLLTNIGISISSTTSYYSNQTNFLYLHVELMIVMIFITTDDCSSWKQTIRQILWYITHGTLDK